MFLFTVNFRWGKFGPEYAQWLRVCSKTYSIKLWNDFFNII